MGCPMQIQEDNKSVFILNEQGERIAESSFVYTGEHLVIIDSTFVDESLKGKNVGKQLIDRIVQRMRKENRKIIPLCPFAKIIFDRNRDYDDIVNR